MGLDVNSAGEVVIATDGTAGSPPSLDEQLEPRAGAETIALQLGIITKENVYGDPLRLEGGKLLPAPRGRKALVGQYVKDKVDQAALINAHLGRYGQPKANRWIEPKEEKVANGIPEASKR